jgi:hypothetical protein
MAMCIDQLPNANSNRSAGSLAAALLFPQQIKAQRTPRGRCIIATSIETLKVILQNQHALSS